MYSIMPKRMMANTTARLLFLQQVILIMMDSMASAFSSLPTTTTTSTAWLRIIQINDVYELDNFPSFKTLVDHYQQEQQEQEGSSCCCVVVCAGDFLAPSLLSSLDQGVAMVDILKLVGCTHVCLGNHETDVPDAALAQRIQQSQSSLSTQQSFQWINTNLPDLNAKLRVETIPYEVLQVGPKRVALLGLLTEDPSLYRPGAFGGATIRPVLETAQDYVDRLLLREGARREQQQDDKVDLIVPLTHQGITQDVAFGEHFGHDVFPIILGGHDHEPYDEKTASSSRIVKTGMDAERAAIIDIRWDTALNADTAGSENDDNGDDDPPKISVFMKSTSDFPPDPVVAERVKGHQAILKELENATLFSVQDWNQNGLFSTKNNRLGPSVGTTALASMLRMGLRCECALLNAGCVRGASDYTDSFSWSDLKTEMPFATPIAVYKIPGHVLEATIQHSRQWAPQGIAKGGYIHTSRSLEYEDGRILTIMGEPFDPNREYLTAFPLGFLRGIDNHVPLLEWARQRSTDTSTSPMAISEEAAVPAKLVLVQVFSALLWLRFGSFEKLSRGDGTITKDDVRLRMMELSGGNKHVADLMLENVFSVADVARDGTVSALEQMIVRFAAVDMLNHVETDEELKVMKRVVSSVLGKDLSAEEMENFVNQLRESLDLRGTGSVQREEILQVLGDIQSKDLLT